MNKKFRWTNINNYIIENNYFYMNNLETKIAILKDQWQKAINESAIYRSKSKQKKADKIKARIEHIELLLERYGKIMEIL